MRTILKSFVASTLAVVAVVGAADSSHARKKRPTYTTKCTCTCIAYENSIRYEGDSLTFDTSGQDCTIGINIQCLVDGSDGLIWGAYASCMGITRVDKIQSSQIGVLQPSAPQPTPRPATSSVGSASAGAASRR